MSDIIDSLWNDHFWIAATCLFAASALFSILADRKRSRRMKFEDVGFMPWTGITVMSVLLAVICAALTIKSG